MDIALSLHNNMYLNLTVIFLIQVLASEWGKLSTPLGGAFGSSNSSAMGPGLGLGLGLGLNNMSNMSVMGSGGLTAAALGNSKGRYYLDATCLWYFSILLLVASATQASTIDCTLSCLLFFICCFFNVTCS